MPYGKHSYWATDKLNARYAQAFPAIMGLGGGTLSGNTLRISGLGQFPWREKSDATVQFQANLNKMLDEAGYCPIGTDGKLGPGTCAAAKLVAELYPGAPVPSECQEFGTRPGKKPCGGGGYTPPPKGKDETPPPDLKRGGMGMSSDILWIVGGVVVAAGAVGAALWMKKKKG